MKFCFTFFTVVTLQLCLIQAREVKEQHVEDKLIEMDADFADSDLKEDLDSNLEEDLDDSDLEEEFEDSDLEGDLDDLNAVELRARPSIRPLCLRTRRIGWGGQCLLPADLKNQSCDFIWGGDVIVHLPKEKTEETCRDEELYCCVDCSVPKQRENCPSNIGHIADVRRECCQGKHNLFTMDSGCKCCGTCSRTDYCKKYHGWCVYKDGEPHYDGRANNYGACLSVPGQRLKYKWCEGRTCACCIPAPPTK